MAEADDIPRVPTTWDTFVRWVSGPPCTYQLTRWLILRLLGFDHTKLTYRYNGRDFRLTDNFGEIVTGILS